MFTFQRGRVQIQIHVMRIAHKDWTAKHNGAIRTPSTPLVAEIFIVSSIKNEIDFNPDIDHH